MAYPATDLSQVTPGEFIDENDWNALVAALNFQANVPACRVFNSAALTHTSNANWQSLSGLDSERYDTDNMHSTVTNSGRITFNTAGLYTVGGCLEFIGNATGIRGLRLFINNAIEIAAIYYNASGGGVGTALTIDTTWKFAAGDFLELQAYQNSGGNLQITKLGFAGPEFWATWIGRG